MDRRPGLATPRPAPLNRSVSGSYALQQGLRKPVLPSRLSNVRSASQPASLVDLTGDGPRPTDGKNSTAFLSNKDHFYTSPDGLNSTDDDGSERPAKRVKTAGPSFQANDGGDADMERDIAHYTLPGKALPPFRRSNVQTGKNNVRLSRRTAVDRAARRANGLEPPPLATRLPAPRNVADFSPWSGQHPEDQLSETVVKTGYSDKAPGPNWTESNSAKPTIWPNLSQKNNMGLQTLSYLFTTVMEKRQALGKCTAPSTFKPPPRVTVTDTKREAWLRDLANPDVPLRKQSRTIPHGIRGKLLMEQCLGKDIPMPRAVWLAKCVGANELRAFRRKGVSGTAAATGEQKWIREWTIHVEQFLEGVIAACGQSDWQSKMDYAVKLATSLYSERLLEKDHYLDWLVTSFAHATADRLPIWVILVQLYWRDIACFGRRGRQLAEAILEFLHRFATGVARASDSLRDRLKKLVTILAVTSRGCLIVPRTWEKYKYLLAPAALSAPSTLLESPAQNITTRNIRITEPLLKTPQTTSCPLLELYRTLDVVALNPDFAQLSSLCRRGVPNLHNLVHALLDWSASVYRTGSSRVYLAATLISDVHQCGGDIDKAVLDYLKTANTTSLLPRNVHRVIAELARLKSFSPGRYLQWLMTSGILCGGKNSTLATDMLAALPVDALPPHLANTRNMLMRRLNIIQSGLAVPAELERGQNFAPSPETLAQIKSANISAKMQLAQRLSLHALTLVKTCGISSHYFCGLRDTLEASQDITALAVVIQGAMLMDDTVLMATITDTVNLHAESLSAVGRLQSIVSQLWERYTALRSQEALNRTYILATTSLLRRFPEHRVSLHVLDNDLTICEQQTYMAVCSPASDNLVSMQASHLDSDHDIDAVFASGNTMDEQLMQRVFSRIVHWAAKPSPPDGLPSKLCQWFNQLRSVDSSCFDQIAKHHVAAYLKDGDGSKLRAISALVAGMCFAFETVVGLAQDAKSPGAAFSIIRLLTSNAVVHESLHPSEAYRLRLQRKRFIAGNPSKVISLLTIACEDPKLRSNLDDTKDLILQYAALDLGEDSASFNRLLQNPIFSDRLIPGAQNVQALIAGANALSITYCAAALAVYARQYGTARSDGGNASLQDAILQAIDSGCDVWPQLLEAAGPDVIKSVYHWAREHVLSNLRQDGADCAPTDSVQRNLDILDVAYHAAGEEENGSVISAVIERFKSIEVRLSNMDANGVGIMEGTQITRCLQVLLHLSILYGVAKESDGDMLKQNRAALLAALCSLLAHPKLQNHVCLQEYVHDVASMVADNVPAEVLSTIARNASCGIAKDPRLCFILGTPPGLSPDAWLALASHPQPQGSQQQKILMKQANGQQQQQRQMSAAQSPLNQKAPIRPGASGVELKTVPFPLRRWEIMPDATPTVGDNDTSLSLALFAARKV